MWHILWKYFSSIQGFGLGQMRYKPYSRSPPSRRARRFFEGGNRQGKQSDFQASNLDRRFDFGFQLIVLLLLVS
ncbi:hypothetical protein ACFX2J_034746 [Malus domestica]